MSINEKDYRTKVTDGRMTYCPDEVKKYGVPKKTLDLMVDIYEMYVKKIDLLNCEVDEAASEIVSMFEEQSIKKSHFYADEIWYWCMHWLKCSVENRNTNRKRMNPDNKYVIPWVV